MIINTRADLDAVAGTPAYDQFMNTLRGTLFNVRKDTELKQWVADETNDTIEHFGFTRADFNPITPPVLPEYVSDPPEVFSCTPWQIRKKLNVLGVRAAVEQMIIDSTDFDVKDGWEYASSFVSDDPFVVSFGEMLGYTPEQTTQLIKEAGEL